MKKIILSVLGIFLFFSCDSFFNQLPKTEVSTDKSFQSYDSALRNVATLYALLGNTNEGINGDERFSLVSLISDGIGRPFSLDAQSSVPRDLWNHHYAFIAQANIILENLEKYQTQINDTYILSEKDRFELVETASTQLIGEVRFLRAYAYFNLYRYFGGVPLILKQTGPQPDYIPRASRQEIFDFIYTELQYAIDHCASADSGIVYGRVTRGAAAGMMVKAKVFHASYIRRAEKYGAHLDEVVEGDVAKDKLYTEALAMADEILEGKYGNYQLEKYFPAVFTKRNKEIMFAVLADEGYSTGNKIPQGFDGEDKQGATGGSPMTTVLPILYDIPMWEHNYRLKDVSWDYGQLDVFNDLGTPKPGTTPNDLQNLYESTQKYSVTGDIIRRAWTTVKGTITGPKMNGAPKGLWVFEPLGQQLGPKFYITPGQKNKYTNDEKKVIEKALAPHERTWWINTENGIDQPDLWHLKRFRLAKFRNRNPWELSDAYESDYAGVDYPILRLAEIYLLKAEAQLFTGDKAGAISSINILRDRACYQSTLQDMFELQGDAPYSYVPGSVMPVPSDISNENALKELLYERLRELAAEDDTGWLDLARFPDVVMEDLNDACRYRDPLHGLTFFSDHTLNEYVWDIFNDEKIYKVLMPVPFTEISYFPQMEQNPGY